MSDSPFMGPAFTPEIDPTVAFPQVVEIPAPRVQLAESSWLHSRGKRFFDLVFTALVLPFFLLIPAAILLESRGPIFFQHRTLGLGGTIFWMFKFRTMIDGADLILSKLLDGDPRNSQITTNLKTIHASPVWADFCAGQASMNCRRFST
jgi:lipopolysaccharide/colanic/teichoic acid biosynthesis glycosyltransferase